MRLRSTALALVATLLPGCATGGSQPTTQQLVQQAAKGEAGCQAAVAYSTENQGLSVLAIKDDKVVCEGYANGATPDKGYEIWSGTKSFTGIAAAILVKDGMLSLDEKVSDTITEWKADPVKSTVTIRQLLSLSSGISNRGEAGGRAPSYATAIATEFFAKPGEKFRYGPQSFQVFGELLQRKMKAHGIPGDSRDFMKTRILDPIGMKWTDWRRTAEGDALMPQGSSFTAREWIKFGEFVRRGGVTEKGERLVDPKAFKELFVGTKANPAYGISWWLPRATPEPDVLTASIDLTKHSTELPQDMVIAGGAGNQRMYVVPSCHMTVVRQAVFAPAGATGGEPQMRGPRVWSDFKFIKTMLDAYCS